MFSAGRAWWRRRALTRDLMAARRSGRGWRRSEWRLDRDADRTLDEEALVEQIVLWCRDTLATCRRPFGVDHFDLTLAWSHADGQRPRRAEWRRVRPIDLYHPERLADQLVRFVRETAADHPSRPALVLAAALFSWGDATHAALARAG